MSLAATLAGLAISAAVFGWANWRQRGEGGRELGDVSLMPLTLIQMAALVAFLVMAAHLVSLLTGVRLSGRIGY